LNYNLIKQKQKTMTNVTVRKKKRKLYLYTMNYLHKYKRNVLDDNDDFYTKSLLVSFIPIKSYRTLL